MIEREHFHAPPLGGGGELGGGEPSVGAAREPGVPSTSDSEDGGPEDGGPEPDAAVGEGDGEVEAGALNDEDRLQLVMAYLGPLCLMPLFGSNDPFIRWHARQGAFFSAVALVTLIVLYPFDWLFSYVDPLWRLFLVIQILLGVGYLFVVALAISRALIGGKFRIPWLADLADEE